MDMDEYPPYTPMPSLNHELGLMFGFLSLFIVAMGAYIALWRISQTRLCAQDLARRRAYHEKNTPHAPLGTTTSVTAGLPPSPGKDSKSKAEVQEKMLDRIGLPENRAELPVHGMELFGVGKWNARTPHIRCPFSRATPLSPVSPASPLGSGTVDGAVGSVSPVRGEAGLGSIFGIALDGGRSLSQGFGFRSASPARRVGGRIGPVEIGPAPSRE
ncbi:uncharacterized protein N7500_001058 [Penicillium coprophilum]|uniref:uncharacterized protein n=1 Tax=Penicillium coprophilum TaxID=36646 RepID=UPI0023834A58|nr:uncharacterized protein N7500_001058 [Penicillium coprophilum]KAJ5178359.1 hypothetical protein N7500_001058 [Penicillium coprophilum]